MDAPSSTSEPFPWRVFWLLFVGTILSVLALVPIALDMLSATLSKLAVPDVPIPLLIFVGVVQNGALLALAIWLGLKLSRQLGLATPILESWLYGKPHHAIGPRLRAGLFTGAGVGGVLLIVLLLLVPRLPNLPLVVVARLPVWKRFLTCFYGGVYEEVFTRLFLLALVAWIANRSWRPAAPKLSAGIFWFANIFVAILFGLGHLPSASLFMAITPLVVVAALVLNGIAGIAFGYLYRRHGLESAMVAHFTADFVIYVAGASLLRS
jgi:hypothetical protein